MARSKYTLVAAGALVLTTMIVLPPSRPISAGAASPIGFETPSVVDPIHTNGEPDIAVDPQGRVFNSGPTGTGTQRSTWFGSVDGGHTFRVMAQKTPPTTISGIPAPQPGGGDTDINFDRSGKQYFADLYALACLRVATTGPTNSGASDQESTLGGCGLGTSPGADRQWLAVYDPAPGTATSAYSGPTPLIYLVYNNLTGPGPNGGEQWNKSTDGLTYFNATADVTVATEALYSPFGGDGYPAIDQVTGKVFQAAGCDNKTCGTSTATTATPGLYLNIGTPDTSGTLHFLDDAFPNQDLTRLIKIADTPTGSPDTLFSVLSMDSGRNLVVVWCISPSSGTPGQRQVFVSAASAASGWKIWTTPVQVSDGSTMTGDAVNVFPWIKAGGPGRAAAVWYGSDKNVDPSSQKKQSWNVFMNQVVFPTYTTGAITGATPTTSLVKVTPHPMHYNDICLMGSACITTQGNRNLADFFVVTIDNTGAAEIVYDDTSNGLAQPGFTPTVNGQPTQLVDHAGAGVITVARQSSGVGLFGTAVSGPSNAPISGLSDPSGDALFPVIGGANQPGMDIRSSQLQMSADGETLNVTMQVVDLSTPVLTAAALAATNVQYVTRWQMGNTIYYAAMQNTAANLPSFYAGAAQSIDLCSVSACFPHVITYPEPGAGPTFTGKTEPGTITCPVATNPCTLTIKVHVADVGGPTANSLLEEVGGYSLAATSLEGAENNATAESDTVPLEIDGVCCYNFQASVQNGGVPVCHEADGNGDIHSANSGKASFSMDEDHCEDLDNEDLHAQDSSANMNFQSTQILSVVFNDALHSVVIAGNGTDNGNPVTFTATAVNGSAGVGTFSLTLSDGYTNSGSLLDGTIQLQ
jgi:hypothetical protein